MLARLLIAAALLTGSAVPQEPMSRYDRNVTLAMLHTIGDDVKKDHYDPQLHGLKWDAIIADARRKIEQDTTLDAGLADITAALGALNDRHTFLVPPRREKRVDYGFQYQMVGDRCYVTRVRPNSDAEHKGVKAGDEILALDGYKVNREIMPKVQYTLNLLRQQPGLRLVLQDPDGNQRQVDVPSLVRENLLDLSPNLGLWQNVREAQDRNDLIRPRWSEYGDALAVLKLPAFVYSADDAQRLVEKADKHKALIMDLRGNPGASLEVLDHMLGGFLDKQVKVADRVGRKETKAEIAKPLPRRFSGKLVVLVDAQSAGASELFARIMQLEKRGTVIGDRSRGSVMESRYYREQVLAGTIFYGVSITERDLIMSDGKSLENTGVTPDEIVLPTAQDLANGRDPVLAHAAEALGVTISPEDAGKAFPYEWPRE